MSQGGMRSCMRRGCLDVERRCAGVQPAPTVASVELASLPCVVPHLLFPKLTVVFMSPLPRTGGFRVRDWEHVRHGLTGELAPLRSSTTTMLGRYFGNGEVRSGFRHWRPFLSRLRFLPNDRFPAEVEVVTLSVLDVTLLDGQVTCYCSWDGEPARV